MNIQIRQCQLKDFEAIYYLNKEAMGYDYPLEKTKQKLEKLLNSSQDKIFVAQINHQVVGYVHANDYDVIYMDHLKNIMGIAVNHDYRHLGIGKRLLLAVENWAKETNAKGVRLVSGETRSGAHQFYQHCGYTNQKKQLNFIKLI